MANEPDEVNSIGWMDAIGLPQILRILGVALHPSKLALALAAIFLTFALGGVLDWFWTRGGGIEGQAITSFIAARADGRTYEEGEGSHGIFEVWRHHEQRCVTGLLGATLPETSLATGTSVGAYVRSLSANRPLPNLLGIGYGVLWMAKSHPVFFLLFGGGSLLIWSLFGGAICRLAVVQFARDEKLPMRDALAYAWPRLLGSFLPAPCIPLAFILIIAIALTLGGALLRVPILGDLLSGVAFLLAILGGFVIAVLMVGLVVGGSLFWPAVAAEGSDAFDAFSRGLSYPLTRPLKAIVYTILALLLTSVCWVLANLFTYLSLTITRGVVGFGTSPFGWWSRGEGGAHVSKLDLLWPVSGPGAMHVWPNWGDLTWYEHFSGFLIGVCVLIVVGLLWSFLASFYFSASTAIYLLLRRDVDGIDLEDVYSEDGTDDGDANEAAPPADDKPQTDTNDISLPVTNPDG